tara:strand:- start:2323 stop:4260 length:1938 start_codon:yes stop_codon:yes gene_type:complete
MNSEYYIIDFDINSVKMIETIGNLDIITRSNSVYVSQTIAYENSTSRVLKSIEHNSFIYVKEYLNNSNSIHFYTLINSNKNDFSLNYSSMLDGFKGIDDSLSLIDQNLIFKNLNNANSHWVLQKVNENSAFLWEYTNNSFSVSYEQGLGGSYKTLNNSLVTYSTLDFSTHYQDIIHKDNSYVLLFHMNNSLFEYSLNEPSVYNFQSFARFPNSYKEYVSYDFIQDYFDYFYNNLNNTISNALDSLVNGFVGLDKYRDSAFTYYQKSYYTEDQNSPVLVKDWSSQSLFYYELKSEEEESGSPNSVMLPMIRNYWFGEIKDMFDDYTLQLTFTFNSKYEGKFYFLRTEHIQCYSDNTTLWIINKYGSNSSDTRNDRDPIIDSDHKFVINISMDSLNIKDTDGGVDGDGFDEISTYIDTDQKYFIIGDNKDIVENITAYFVKESGGSSNSSYVYLESSIYEITNVNSISWDVGVAREFYNLTDDDTPTPIYHTTENFTCVTDSENNLYFTFMHGNSCLVFGDSQTLEIGTIFYAFLDEDLKPKLDYLLTPTNDLTGIKACLLIELSKLKYTLVEQNLHQQRNPVTFIQEIHNIFSTHLDSIELNSVIPYKLLDTHNIVSYDYIQENSSASGVFHDIHNENSLFILNIH